MSNIYRSLQRDLAAVIEMSAKKTELLKEYKESLTYEQCDYDLVKQPNKAGYYFLFKISTSTMVADGTAKDIRRFVTRHSSPERVHNYGILTQILWQ